MKMRMINRRMQIVFIAVLMLLVSDVIFAQDPGDTCDPDGSSGIAARVLEVVGQVNVTHSGKASMTAETGTRIPPGYTIETGAGTEIVLQIEDGTSKRDSRLRVTENSRLTVSGGLYCSDLRPKYDGGRWAARKFNLDLQAGSVSLSLSEDVNYAYNMEITTPNTVARMRRASNVPMSAEFIVKGLKAREKVSVLEHPEVKKGMAAFLMGRNIDDLGDSDKQAIMMQAVMLAVNQGIVDVEELGIMDHPQIKSTIAMITGGRSLSALDDNEKAMAVQMAGTMALSQGLLSPEGINVYSQPDEHTRILVHHGTFRVQNRHRSHRREEIIDVSGGMYSEITGTEVPALAAISRDQ